MEIYESLPRESRCNLKSATIYSHPAKLTRSDVVEIIYLIVESGVRLKAVDVWGSGPVICCIIGRRLPHLWSSPWLRKLCICAFNNYRYWYRICNDVGRVIDWADYHTKWVRTYETYIVIDLDAEKSVIICVLFYPRLRTWHSVRQGATSRTLKACNQLETLSARIF